MRCYICKKEKDASAFSRDKSRERGYSGRCKLCDNLYRRQKRKRNPEHYRLRDKRYNIRHKEQRNRYSLEYNKKNKYKIVAHRIVRKAIKSGLLTKKPCEKCGNKKTEAHHDDYSKPLQVQWLCRNHHRLAPHNKRTCFSPSLASLFL